jgi:hypothetical protein
VRIVPDDPNDTRDDHSWAIICEDCGAYGYHGEPPAKVDTPPGICGLCGQPMPPGEEMFRYHGYSGPCPETQKDTSPP